jgi:hypothetical protein
VDVYLLRIGMANFNQITHDYPRSHVRYGAVTVEIPAGTTDYDIDANTDLFSRVEVAREFNIKTTEDIQIRINDTGNDAIDVWAEEGFILVGYPTTNFFVTTGSSASILRFIVIGWN